MQRDGELAGLEGVISLWGTERTHCCFRCAFLKKALERFREAKQRLVILLGSGPKGEITQRFTPLGA